MADLLYKEEIYKIVGLCMEVHRNLGRGHSEVIYKDALEIEFRNHSIPFEREKQYKIEYKGIILPHFYYADFVLLDKVIFEAKAVETLVSSHTKQTLNYLATSKLKVGLLVNFGSDSLEYKRVIL